jgi:hypothetical protein
MLDEFGKGALKGAGSTAFRALKIAEKIGNATGLTKLVQHIYGYTPGQMSLGATPSVLQTKNTPQKIGFGAEQVGELLVPGLDEASLAAKAAKFGKAAELGAKSLLSGADFAARTALQTGGDAKKTAESGIVGSATPPLVKGAGAVLSKIAPPIGRTAAAIIGGMIGKEPEHIIRAFENPEAVAKGMAEKVIPYDVRRKAVKALNAFRKSYQSDFERGLETIKNTYPYGKTGKLLVQRDVNDATNGIPRIFRDFRIGVTQNGAQLNFDKLNSAIVSPGEQNNLRKAYATIRGQKDFSVQGVQDVAARLSALQKYTEGGSTRTSAIIGKIHDAYDRAIQATYPELGKLRSNYRAAVTTAKEIDSVLKSVADAKMSVPAVTTAVRKLSNLFAEDNEAYLQAIHKLEKISGVDLLNELAASEFRNIMPRSLGSHLGQAGVLAGGILQNPLLLLTLPLFSPRLEGKVVTTAGKVLPKAAQAVKTAIPPAIKAVTRFTQETQ